jgi:hypothetical protein
MSQHSVGINDLIDGKGPIWVINTSNQKYKGGAEVYITISQGDQASVFQVPRSWLPIEITARYPRKAICESPYFMESLNEKLITVISAEDALKLMGSKEASRERNRLREQADAVKAANASRGIGKNVMISTGDMNRDKELSEAANDGPAGKANNFVKKVNFDETEEDEVAQVEAGFQAWVIKLNGMNSVEDVKTELRMRGDMTIEEAIYVMKNCDHDPITEKIRKRLVKLGEVGA